VSAPPLPKIILEGEREKWMVSYAGTIRRYGASADAIFAALVIENEQRCRPPLEEADLRRIARSMAKKSPSVTEAELDRDRDLRELNDHYAVLRIGKDTVILDAQDAEFTPMSERSFRLWMRNRLVAVPGENGTVTQRRLADRWLEWSERREYRKLVFKPGEKVVPDAEFNLWRGWAVEPVGPGRCGLFRRHLLTVVCRGQVKHYEWLLDWLADIVQRPMRKLGFLVALRGAQGVGKSLVGRMMKLILGVHHIAVEKPEHVTGRFNAHIAYCLLLQCEEAFWAGDKRARGALKHLVTGEDQMIDRKGIDAISMPNYTRLLITSNEDLVWPTEADDRRLVIFDVKATHKDDAAYFKALFAEMEDGGAAAFLRFLLARKIDERRLTEQAPVTRALRDQVILTMPAEEAWLLEQFTHRRLPRGTVVDADGYAHLPVGALYERYADAVPSRQHTMNETQFGLFLAPWKTTRELRYRGKHRFTNARYQRVLSKPLILRPLAWCRKRYSARGRGAPKSWPGASRWRVEEEK
jgi:hypothetical protein